MVRSIRHIGASPRGAKHPRGMERGCSSGVEHNLAKVRVVGSNPIARSKILTCLPPWRSTMRGRTEPLRAVAPARGRDVNTITHNWSQYVAFGANAAHFPRTVAEVQDVVRRSDKIRAVGARHSFNHIADTPGALISLRALERRVEIDAAARTVTVDGGITHAELVPALDAAGWALFNLASVPDFTVVGAVMTAIHGSGNTNRNLAGSVAALEIVTASGEIVTFRRGEGDFDGAVVSLGALGVVTAMTLDLVPRFEMRQDVFHRLPFETVADNFDVLMGSAYSVSLFTHWNGDVVDQAWLKGLAGSAPGTEFFGGKPALANCSPVIGKEPYGTTEQMGVAGPWFDRLPHARIGALPAEGYEYQSEYFVARHHAPAAMHAIKADRVCAASGARRQRDPARSRRTRSGSA